MRVTQNCKTPEEAGLLYRGLTYVLDDYADFTRTARRCKHRAVRAEQVSRLSWDSIHPNRMRDTPVSENSSGISQYDHYRRLMEALPDMVEVVNKFDSKKSKHTALKALIGAFGVPNVSFAAPSTAPSEASLTVVPPLASEEATAAVITAPAKKAVASKKAAKRSYAKVKDVNFRPDGKAHLRDFASEKAPSTFHEKNLVVVYYFEETLDFHEITVGHVLAGYEECGWKAPAIPDNSLQVTAASKGWLDTADMKAVKTTHGGRNTLKYDMPASKENTSA